ncbi:hypothetical protein QBC46DRAFT_143133 [Diplogelasinospora grovesii]|uniref:Uncharacterized protein n=1 Tax=Diplogelasinospora grovesii TaxID=303347 RepID=A0AAN6N6S7_9PEZI|nr:hypothetical protein QBC46DRAFT_143133 [Diplogelasinospora grovesii]
MVPDQSMLKAYYNVHWLYNVAAAISSWILLAGFIVLPGTFTSLQNLKTDTGAVEVLQSFAERIGLLSLSACCWISGVVGIGSLWWKFRQRHNYLWLLDHLFLPGLLNAMSGLVVLIVWGLLPRWRVDSNG